LPADIVAAFGSPHVIGISHAATLAPLLRTPDQSERLTAEARGLAIEQTDLAARGAPAIQPAAVLQRLSAAAREPVLSRQPGSAKAHVVRSSEGSVVARGQRAGRGGGITISIPAPARHERAALLAALEEILNQISQRDRKTRPDNR
jgi:ParB family transcriptional regulator, chromosome partitioning protein